MRQFRILIVIKICFILFIPCLSRAETHHLNINCTIHSPYEAFFFRLVKEACARNKVTVTASTPPVGRSLVNVNEGIDDGDGPRIAGLTTAYPDMVRVSEPFGDFVFGAFTKKRELRIHGWDSLSDLNVAYITGWKIFDREVKHAKSITKVKNKVLLFKLLDVGRTDVAMITRLAGRATVRELGLQGVRFLEPPLAIVPNYLYLNKKHAALAVKLAETLREMKRDGTWQKYHDEIITPHLTD